MSATRVMVVGDDATIVDSVRRALCAFGYRLTGIVATSGEALEHARREQPDIALMDVTLGDALGYVEAIERRFDIPVVFLAGHAEGGSLARATRTAAHGCVLLPFRDCDLAAAVEVALSKHRADRQAHDLHTRLVSTLASIDDAVIVTDGHAAILYMNPAARALLDSAVDDGASLVEVLRAVAPQLGASVANTLDEVGRTGQRAHDRCTLHTRTGAVVDFRYTLTPTRDPRRADGYVLVLHDATELARVTQRLVAELRDRVNNNLQSIQGLLAIQADHIADERYAKTFRQWQHRVLAMSLVYQHLARFDDVQRVDFAGYARQLAEQLRARYGGGDDRVELHFDIATLDIGIDTAIPLGLLLTELVTNAVEHAFPHRRRGNIEIALRELAPGLAELSVCDDGVGLPPGLAPDASATFGFELVRGIGESALGGRVSFEGDGAGTAVRLCFPLAARSAAATPLTQ